ncbi:MAG: B12-binding domain-containing radical SAM protein [Rhodospirillales bacterium]
MADDAETAASGRVLRCAFVHAPEPVYSDTQNYGAKFMPVWAYTLAAHAPDDGRVAMALYDTRFDRLDDIGEADVFLFSGINQDCTNLERVRAMLTERYPAAVSVIGGPICWSFDQAGTLDHLDGFDHVCIGDGEEIVARVLEAVHAGRPLERVIRAETRFPIVDAQPLYRPMVEKTIGRYYGAVLEVSRGCPFLCEFCDIRIMADNNRPHNKPPALIVQELDALARLGVNQVLFACDNFIGEPRWAEDVVDRIIEWEQETGFRVSLYTWLTINLYKHPSLMAKMRRAGFDMLFIGIESFDNNSLLETAKLQNSASELVAAVRQVQSYGFIVVAGLIFGFDSDDERSFGRTLQGLKDSALLSGDPSLLTALPGTPLYRRVKLAGRLRDVRFGLGGYKYQTNIKYLMTRDQMIDGYGAFVTGFTDGKYQYGRLKGYFDLLAEEGNFIPLETTGFGNFWLFIRMIMGDWPALKQMTERLARFARHPTNIYYAFKGLALALRRLPRGGFGYFQFWFFAWTNAVLKYQNISADDFDIEGVDDDFDIRDILPAGYETTADEMIPQNKIDAQLRATTAQLSALVERRQAAAGRS